MPNIDIINHYINNLLFTVSRPRIAEILSSSVNIENIKKADTATKLMSLGALFTTGKFDECIQLADKLDFSEITDEDSLLLVLILFSKFYEHGLVGHYNANSLKHLLTAICPGALLAHKQFKEPFSPPTLIKLDYSHDISSSVSGAIFTGEFTLGPNSRKSEIGYRIKKALISQGWAVSIFPVTDVRGYSSVNIKDFALIDVFAFQLLEVEDICNILSLLRRSFRKIILFDADVWAGRFDDMLRAISSHIDYIWGFTADWRLIDEPVFKGRSILFPNFGGFDHLEKIITAPLDWNSCTFNFTGAVQSYNLNRIYWLLEIIHRNLPLKIKITNPEIDDGLDPASSQQMYAQVVAATHAAINLTTRTDGSRIVTGRSLEVISLNRLLIQENCPAFNRYFVEGEHFLEFSDTDELDTIIEFLGSHPKTAQKVCSLGHRFYLDRYSCKKLVEHFQTFL
ncbi:MAG: hypothetical protein A2X82_05830 [Geobacteraceae bacterium GWC2_55_20]|nr:MAG: hypothetical protein A2X82_05830 [Geobacteraceae bacterium GWC2_55_20]OGU26081.1 MAG: hypothetical protein A2X85_09250 [Geobacteraceae bacterium GWF2_54_21]HCE66581.1 hypothetical protein [Geobacter sp.]